CTKTYYSGSLEYW
nr:immunoglobulin heavy chain junction region [Macaca mulatta]